MGSSIGILSVEKMFLEDFFKKEKTLTLMCDGATNLGNFEPRVTLSSPETIIALKHSNEKEAVFSVRHFTDTIERPIRTWSDHIMIDDRGYQEVHDYEMIYDKGEKELYVLLQKDLIPQFMRRLSTRQDLIKVKRQHFSLDITSFADILNIYGSWSKVDKENISCEAKFGVNVLDGEPNKKDLIAINMKVKSGDETFNVTLSREGHISSNSRNGGSGELIPFYKKLKSELLN